MWIVIGIVAVLGFIVLVPVLVVGTWYVVITVIMGLADGAIWLLDEGWRTIRGRKSRAEVQTKLLLGLGDANGKKQPIPVVTVRGAVTTGMGCFLPFASPSPRSSFVCTSARLFRPRIVLHPSSSNHMAPSASPMITVMTTYQVPTTSTGTKTINPKTATIPITIHITSSTFTSVVQKRASPKTKPPR